MLGSASVDPLAVSDLWLLWDAPLRFQPVTVEPDQNLLVHLTAGPAAHLGGLRY